MLKKLGQKSYSNEHLIWMMRKIFFGKNIGVIILFQVQIGCIAPMGLELMYIGLLMSVELISTSINLIQIHGDFKSFSKSNITKGIFL